MRISKAFLYKSYSTEELQAIIAHLFRKIPLSPTSKTQYATKIPQWLTYLPTPPRTLHQLISNPAASLKHLENTTAIKHSPTNHHIYISSVVAFIKYILKNGATLQAWKAVERTNWTPLAEHYEENKPTELQSDKVITFEEVDAVRRSLERGSTERLLLSFYTLIEPIRADYYATEIVTSPTSVPTEANYILLGPPLHQTPTKLVVTDFKTRQKYEKIENTLSPELVEELQASLEKHPRRYLFVMEDGQTPFTRKLFSNWACRTLTRVLKRPMTLTVLRHVYITNKMQMRTPASEMRRIATKMGHSRGIQRVYEWQKPHTV